MPGRRGRYIAAALRWAAVGVMEWALLGAFALAAPRDGSPDPLAAVRARVVPNEGRWSVKHSAAVDGAGHLLVRKGLPGEHARWMLIYGMTIGEALSLQERVDGTELTIKLVVFPKGSVIELEARASEDWQVLTVPLTRKHIEALARGAEVYLSAGDGAVTYWSALAGSAKAIGKALNP